MCTGSSRSGHTPLCFQASCPLTKGLSRSTSDQAQTHRPLWAVPTSDLFLGNQAPPKAVGVLGFRRGNQVAPSARFLPQ